MQNHTSFLPAEIIKKKRNGVELTEKEINYLIQSYTNNDLPDYQMAAWLMAVYFNGMTQTETLSLTKAMIESGVVVDFKNVPEFKVDKHSTGGVGDKTSLILGPIVSAAGTPVPMISGRGLGHTGGTLDKLESIPGFNTQLDLAHYISNIEKHKIAFIGQTKEICPADKKIYALRDVTATVESLPLICASIMSKKLAEGIDGLVLDVKYGSGAFMKTQEKATELAKALMAIGRGYGKKVTSLITSMNQPLGRFAGNSLEVYECVEIMKNKSYLNSHGYDSYADTRELSLQLSAHMLFLTGKYTAFENAYAVAQEVLLTGKAFNKFSELCDIHGGDLNALPVAKYTKTVYLKESSGYLASFNTEKIGIATILLKAGRAKKEDLLDHTSGIEFHAKIGDLLKSNEPLFTIYGNDESLFPDVIESLNNCFTISLQTVPKEVLINSVIT